MKQTKIAILFLASFSLIFSSVIIPTPKDTAAARTVYQWVAPKPTGKWTYVKTLKYSSPNTKDLKTFSTGVAGYILTSKIVKESSNKNLLVAGIVTGFQAVFSSKIKGNKVYVSVKCYYRENKYVLQSKRILYVYSDSKRKKLIKTYPIANEVIKDYKLVKKEV